ncbi:hypothetical protein [Flexithrix dorotheae]|uniref:hypothetical protein n=1 Tax=Flexithrix dorotheae TaxID=70993 RepID=UPI0003761BA6|nr:hypothetical protein [Flexithrix dorotheae]
MNEDKRLTIENLIIEATYTKSPITAQNLLSKAIDLADSYNFPKLQFESRAQYMLICFRSGFHDRSLATFPWLLDYFKKAPEKVNQQSILVLYITAVNGITEFPNIFLDQINQVLEEMKTYYLKFGYSLKEAYRISRHAMLEMGREDLAQDFMDKVESASKGPCINDSPASDLFAEVTYLDHLGNYQEAIDTAQPLFNQSYPFDNLNFPPYTALLTSFVKTGQMDKAVDCFKKAQQSEFLTEFNHLWYTYKFLFFKVLTRNFDEALDLFKNCIAQAIGGHAFGLSYLFYLSSSFLLKQLSKQKIQTLHLKLPKTFPNFNPEGEYSLVSFLEWLNTEIDRLELQFNARNQNDFFTRLKMNHLELESFISAKKIDLN